MKVHRGGGGHRVRGLRHAEGGLGQAPGLALGGKRRGPNPKDNSLVRRETSTYKGFYSYVSGVVFLFRSCFLGLGSLCLLLRYGKPNYSIEGGGLSVEVVVVVVVVFVVFVVAVAVAVAAVVVESSGLRARHRKRQGSEPF